MPRLDLEVDPVDRDGVAVDLPEFPRFDHAPPPFISLMAVTLRAARPHQPRPQEGNPGSARRKPPPQEGGPSLDGHGLRSCGRRPATQERGIVETMTTDKKPNVRSGVPSHWTL